MEDQIYGEVSSDLHVLNLKFLWISGWGISSVELRTGLRAGNTSLGAVSVKGMRDDVQGVRREKEQR